MTDTTSLTMQDRLEILELFARYNWALETNHPEQAAALFTEDGVFDGVSGTYRGHEEITRMGARARENDGPINSQHWIGNHVFDGDSQRVEVRSMALGPGMEQDTFHMTFQGYYVDDIVKVEGAWRFAYRYFRLWRGKVRDGAEPWATERVD